MNKIFTKYSFPFFGFFLILGCSTCNNKNLSGKYYKRFDADTINYIEIKTNGIFLHYYSNSDTILQHQGRWEIDKKGYCIIEFDEWKTFDQKGVDFEIYGNQILYINGNHLNYDPDGNDLSSFKKSKSR